MAQPYVGEIRMFAGNFPPLGWEFCEGQLLPISENEVLFQIIGTTYGGDGESTFALPDLRGRLPIHQGQGSGLSSRILGETGGVEAVTLTVTQIPAHSHPLLASNDLAAANTPAGSMPAVTNVAKKVYAAAASPPAPMAPASISPAGGSQPHTNFQPYLCVNFIISLFGLFPSQT
jgi:microcystin-dependent protein